MIILNYLNRKEKTSTLETSTATTSRTQSMMRSTKGQSMTKRAFGLRKPKTWFGPRSQRRSSIPPTNTSTNGTLTVR